MGAKTRIVEIPEWTGDPAQGAEYKDIADALFAERNALLEDLREIGVHSEHCAAYKTIGRFGSRSGLRWSAGDEKTCDCRLGVAIRGGAMSAKHTPKPWFVANRISGDTEIVADSIDGATIATVWGGARAGYPLPVDSNARLIAAAPDLLVALVALLDSAERSEAGYPQLMESRFAIRDIARAAIAKARGGK